MKRNVALGIWLNLITLSSFANQLTEDEINRIREERITAFKEKKAKECEYWIKQNKKIDTNTTRSMIQENCSGKKYRSQAKPVAKEVETECGVAIDQWHSDKSEQNAYKAGETCFPELMPNDIKLTGEDGTVYWYGFSSD